METDCYETPFSQLYLYIYKITDQTNEKPYIKEIVPLQYLQEREITIRTEKRDGTANARFAVEMNETVCDDLLMEIRTGVSAHQFAELRKSTVIEVILDDLVTLIRERFFARHHNMCLGEQMPLPHRVKP